MEQLREVVMVWWDDLGVLGYRMYWFTKINERRYIFFSLEHLTTIRFEATRIPFWYAIRKLTWDSASNDP